MFALAGEKFKVVNQDRPTTNHQYHEPFAFVVVSCLRCRSVNHNQNNFIKTLIIAPVDSHSSFLIFSKPNRLNARYVMAAFSVVRNNKISLLWELTSIFMQTMRTNFLFVWAPTWRQCIQPIFLEVLQTVKIC